MFLGVDLGNAGGMWAVEERDKESGQEDEQGSDCGKS